ncbi:PREDICTED: uncharacterized protein LOC109208813 [Nicotiana attenuata]|uniref:uncharacterized protein LOC109208813 n=1 Tax=Nicotiana attenuata TaxID=49451 RepID=UPI000905D216|nr:PREDICTED: uncharacterized protein LOC109208813 [Nicotiana attenuata]
MAKEIRKLTLAKVQSQSSPVYDFCGTGHPLHECQALAADEVVNVVGNFDRGNYQGAKQKDEPIERHAEIVEEHKNDDIQKGAGMVEDDLKKKGKIRGQKKMKNDNSTNNETKQSKYMPALPFPHNKREMPASAKVMKEILSNKRKVEETSVVKLTEHCSAVLKNKLPKKYGGPRSFTISYSLGSTKFQKSLCDSGASINLMPLCIFRKLEGEIGEIKSITVSLQLADQTIIIPEGIVEDVLVWVDKFVFPVDFIVFNMEENREVPQILGRPFLATSRTILDIQERQLMLRVGDEKLVFKMEGERGP